MSDTKFWLFSGLFWLLLFGFIFSGCAHPVEKEKTHEPPEMLAMPTGREMCEKYLSPKDIELLMRLNNFTSCMSELEFKEMRGY